MAAIDPRWSGLPVEVYSSASACYATSAPYTCGTADSSQRPPAAQYKDLVRVVETTWKCEYCGQRNRPDEARCFGCGASKVCPEEIKVNTSITVRHDYRPDSEFYT